MGASEWTIWSLRLEQHVTHLMRSHLFAPATHINYPDNIQLHCLQAFSHAWADSWMKTYPRGPEGFMIDANADSCKVLWPMWQLLEIAGTLFAMA